MERKKISKQVEDKLKKAKIKNDNWSPFQGNLKTMISTGSTLLDLAISGGVTKEGGLPAGIMVEIAGEHSSGKTVMLCEIAGNVQRKGGDVLFNDPEARLNTQFAQLFDLNVKDISLKEPNTVKELFNDLNKWEPEGKADVHGIFVDSLAALSTEMEMENEDGDKMGGRRAKEFSEGFRKFCRVLKKENYLMVCSNQLRESMAAFGKKYIAPGGQAIGFYSSIRLNAIIEKKLVSKKEIRGKTTQKTFGTVINVEVVKSSVDAPFRTAPIYIIFDYGIDDIRANLQFLKDYSKSGVYFVGDKKLDKSMDKSIQTVEEEGLEKQLKEEVILLWNEIQEKHKKERRPKQRG